MLTAGVDASTTRSAPSISVRSLCDVSTALTSKPSRSSMTEWMMPPSLPVPPTRATRVIMRPSYVRGTGGPRSDGGVLGQTGARFEGQVGQIIVRDERPGPPLLLRDHGEAAIGLVECH